MNSITFKNGSEHVRCLLPEKTRAKCEIKCHKSSKCKQIGILTSIQNHYDCTYYQKATEEKDDSSIWAKRFFFENYK
jgi:hypothetical protein